MYFDCTECIFATNSPGHAEAHTEQTGHVINEEDD